VTNPDSNTVSVIDTAANAVVATIPVGLLPRGIAITPDGTRAYVMDLGDNTASVLDTATNAVVATIPVGKAPFGVAITPASHVVTFASGTGTRVYKFNHIFLGLAENVCLNASFPANCPAGATLYGHQGSGWLADLSSIPKATWIYAPGITGESSPAQLVQYFFQTTFVIPATPTAGTLFVAADDAAQVMVNGSVVGRIGSLADVSKASDAQNRIHKFDITRFLVKGKNRIRIGQENGPARFGGCAVPDNYTCNPSGVVFGGSATW